MRSLSGWSFGTLAASEVEAVSEAKPGEYVAENREFLARVLAHGDAEARGYALALIAEGGELQDIDAVMSKLEEIRQQKAEP